jgi:hypothetical protein
LDVILNYLKICPENSSSLKKIFYNIYNEIFTTDSQTEAILIEVKDGYIPDFTVSNTYKMGKIQKALLHLSEQKLVYYTQGASECSLTFEGIKNPVNFLVTSFEKSTEREKLNEEHLKQSIQLTKEQIIDIRKSKIRSWIAIIISVIAIASSISTNYSDYVKDHSNNRKSQSPPR